MSSGSARPIETVPSWPRPADTPTPGSTSSEVLSSEWPVGTRGVSGKPSIPDAARLPVPRLEAGLRRYQPGPVLGPAGALLRPLHQPLLARLLPLEAERPDPGRVGLRGLRTRGRRPAAGLRDRLHRHRQGAESERLRSPSGRLPGVGAEAARAPGALSAGGRLLPRPDRLPRLRPLRPRLAEGELPAGRSTPPAGRDAAVRGAQPQPGERPLQAGGPGRLVRSAGGFHEGLSGGIEL